MKDDSTTVSELRQVVQRFVTERDWRQFHAPKNLSMALAVEAAELMEQFQWLTAEASRAVRGDFAKKAAVAEEMADVFCYLLALADELEVDLSHALSGKMIKNAEKYPADQIRGRFGPDDPGQ